MVSRSMRARGLSSTDIQRFALQCGLVLFLEDTHYFPDKPFRRMLGEEPLRRIDSEALCRILDRLDLPLRFLKEPRSIALDENEWGLIREMAERDWSAANLGILGEVFQAMMSPRGRHEHGAHYTPDGAIFQHILRPILIEPWRTRIRGASTLADLFDVHEQFTNLRILDPACGSGNFLFGAYRAIQQLEHELIAAAARFTGAKTSALAATKRARTLHLFGIDKDPFAVELTRVILFAGQIMAARDPFRGFSIDCAIVHADALFCSWPEADLIIGNPPFQSKNRMQQEFGPEYVQRLHQKYPDVPGRADYCVYWFRRAHDELASGASAGLVGTNTIRQNYSREGGLDYIVKNGGTVTEAVSTMVWPGEAVVHVSVVNWTKGPVAGLKTLSWQEGDQMESPWHETRLATIPPSLSPHADVTSAKTLRANTESAACFQGQTHGHEGFLVTNDEASSMVDASKKNSDVIFPYLFGDDLLSRLHGAPSRWVIDFHPREQLEAQNYAIPFQRIKDTVLPHRETTARQEKLRNENLVERGNRHHENFLKRWWLLSYPRGELMTKLKSLNRYIACSRVTKRPIFEFVSSAIHPSDALTVFPLEDDYSFGILQSALHWAWFTARCSTLTARFRYTSETVFNSFPWPQTPTKDLCLVVAKCAVALRALRQEIAQKHQMNLRALYTSMDDPGDHPLRDAHAALDKAVRAAYEMPARKDALTFLLDLNQACAEKEARGEEIAGPGLPKGMATDAFMTNDCVEPPFDFGEPAPKDR